MQPFHTKHWSVVSAPIACPNSVTALFWSDAWYAGYSRLSRHAGTVSVITIALVLAMNHCSPLSTAIIVGYVSLRFVCCNEFRWHLPKLSQAVFFVCFSQCTGYSIPKIVHVYYKILYLQDQSIQEIKYYFWKQNHCSSGITYTWVEAISETNRRRASCE